MRNALIGAAGLLLAAITSAQAVCYPKFGTNGPDTLKCDPCGDCKLIGLGDDDILIGLDGWDVLYPDACQAAGAAGLDPKDCKNGKDTITTGPGYDAVVFDKAAQSKGDHVDMITDFEQGHDVIAMAGVLYHAGGLDAVFIGSAPFDGVAGEVRYRWAMQPAMLPDSHYTAQTLTIVEADLDGDGQPDFEVSLIGQYTLTADDFLFNSYPPQDWRAYVLTHRFRHD